MAGGAGAHPKRSVLRAAGQDIRWGASCGGIPDDAWGQGVAQHLERVRVAAGDPPESRLAAAFSAGVLGRRGLTSLCQGSRRDWVRGSAGAAR
jgi:hypothetical protein